MIQNPCGGCTNTYCTKARDCRAVLGTVARVTVINIKTFMALLDYHDFPVVKKNG